MKTTQRQSYKVAFPISNGDYYVEIRRGGRFLDWLKVDALPPDCSHLLCPGLGRWDSVRCKTKREAELLVERVTLAGGARP